jgi:hypothetical protein
MNLEQCEKTIPTVIMGSDKSLDIKLVSELSGDPFDMTAATEIMAILLNADGSFLERKMTTSGIVLVSGPGGHFQIVLTAANTTLLQASPVDCLSNIEIHIVIAGLTTIVLLKNSVKIIPRLYPTAP